MAIRAKALQIVKYCEVTVLHVFDLYLGMMNLYTGGGYVRFIIVCRIHPASFAVKEAMFLHESGLLLTRLFRIALSAHMHYQFDRTLARTGIISSGS